MVCKQMQYVKCDGHTRDFGWVDQTPQVYIKYVVFIVQSLLPFGFSLTERERESLNGKWYSQVETENEV